MRYLHRKNIRAILLLVAVCALAVFVFFTAFHHDNKYTKKQPNAADGVLVLDKEAIETYPVMFLIGGWEYYDGKLLSPEDFAREYNTPMPDKFIYIGQYGGFDAGDRTAPPHGSATYRLVIHIPEQRGQYMLELPEIFSAYRAYVNGNEVMRMGDPTPDSYRPETGNRTVTFDASGKVEIIIAASDYSHIYSGMTYPPAFGEPEHVASLLGSRLSIRGAVCAVALTIALLSLLIRLTSRSGIATPLYSLLCVCFIGYVSYPLLHSYFRGFQPFYVIENVSFCVMLLLTMLLVRRVFELKDKWGLCAPAFGLLCCAAAAFMPFLAPLGNTSLFYVYSLLISSYHWITAAYITLVTARALAEKAVSGLVLLCGILVFDCALVMDRLLPLFEPILGGWFIEIGSFALIIAVGAAISLEVAAKYRQSAILAERANSMERIVQMQQGYFTVLKQEMDETKAVRHDLRHHFMVIEGLLSNKQYDELTAYIAECNHMVRLAKPQIHSDNNIINILVHHYNALCTQGRITLDVRYELTKPVSISDTDLCGIMSNLLENAVEACLRMKTGRREIRLGFMNMGDDLIIRVENTTDSNLKQRGNTFVSSKGEDRVGYGLTSIRAIAKRNAGDATFEWDREKRVFTAIVVL